MKNIYKLLISRKATFILVVVFSVLACDDRWTEMNTDPNRISDLPDEYLFTNAVRQTFRNELSSFEVDFGGQYSHIWVSSNWVREADKFLDYNAQGDRAEYIFSGIYNGPVRNINEVLKITESGAKYENAVHFAQATVIKVANLAKMVDLFGDVPYSQAGMGKYNILKPVYDKQNAIYDDMLKNMKDSVNVLKSASSDQAYTSKEDPLYSGNIGNWARFANSLRLRIAMRARNTDVAKYNTVIQECLQLPLIETNQQSATLQCWNSENGELYNPWNNYYIDISSGTYVLNFSELFINTLKNTNDPRLPFFASKNTQGQYVGMPNGLTDEYYPAWNRSNTSVPTAQFFAKDQSMFFMSAAEIWLLRAELALDGIGGSNSNEMYQNGIKLAMAQWKINVTEIDKYISTEKEATLYGDKTNKVRQISTQLWISFAPNGFEAWSTMRRTGYPAIPVRDDVRTSKGHTNGVLPSRIKYPYTVEKSVNGENLANAISSMGADKIDLKLWWNKK